MLSAVVKPVHREGYRFIAAFAIATVLLFLVSDLLGAVGLVLTIWCVYFFRDPARVTPTRAGLVVSPADGIVSAIGPAAPPPELGLGDASLTRVSVFMNVFDCHVNRYPLGGTVAYRHYNPGKFLNAADEKSSLENEQSSVGLDTPHGRILARQIAGLVARRIITDHPVGTVVQQGQRLGMIRFGSRVDLFLPLDANVLVQTGTRVKCGLTVVARWN